jgi:L-fuconolactonase
MPSFPIIDSHVHLYDPAHLSYPWLKNVPKINRRYDLGDLDRCRGTVEIEKIVFAEVAVGPGLHVDEAAWVQRLADTDARLRGMVAHAPVENGAAVVEDLDRVGSFAILRGIRRLIEVEADPTFCLEPGFIEGVKTVGRHGLPFDICVKHWSLVFGVELVKRCPDVQFVLDHIGKPGIRQGIAEPWRTQIKELSRLPNVVVKISGVITEADHKSWTREQVKPYVAHVIDHFGFERCMFGSDWTVSELTHRYPDWVDIVDEVIAGSSEAEARQLYRGTAERIYRLP